MDDKYIPLLSGKKFSDFTPEEFKAHVVSLYHKKEAKKVKKKEVPPIVMKISPKGVISLRINREPKYITDLEIKDLFRDASIEVRPDPQLTLPGC